MYPRAELTLLEHRKAILQARIALQRIELAGQLEAVSRPLVWIDGVRARWQGVPSIVRLLSGPLILIVQRLLIRRAPVGGNILAWLPVAWRVWQWAAPFLRKTPPTRPPASRR
ncbi:MAG: hypothetical protein JNJ82_12565 [Opitutaceae bacterium]|nr:hypothetical protein [Opitutaceae bacterium]